MASFTSIEFYKYRRKSGIDLLLPWMCLCLTMIQLNAEEVYQCNNETQTCITESLRGEQNEQQLYNIPSPLSSWKELPQCRGKILLEDSSGFISDGTGNYSLDTKCSWLLTTDAPNSTIILQLIEFATECSWDHLYIYDGDSVLAPLLAVYSGLTLYGDYRVQEVNEVTTSSNSVLLHFYSDLAYNMSGFNISYSINSCPVNKDGKKCSGNGVCIDSSCTCDAAFYGQSCQYAICPDNCSEHGFCNMETHSCICDEGWSGLDCNQPKGRGFWMSVWKPNETQQNHLARTQSSGAIWKGILWVVGGHTLDLDFPLTMAFNISDNAWLPVETNGLFIPRPRHGHSTVIYNGILYMYGGVTQDGDILSQLWTLNLSTKEWTQLMPSRNKECYHRPCGPVAAAGHSVVLVKDKMYTIFGYNPIYGYLNLIQEYSIDNRIWSVVSTSGALVQGSYGHSSVWDPLTKRIYVYGGYRSESSSIYELTNALYSYDPAQKVWRTHPSSGSYRYLHSAVMSGGLMLVYGGNTHNETAISNGAKCYSSDFIAYDTICDTWYKLQQPLPKSVGGDLSRYGHLAVSFGLSYEVEVDDEYHQPLLPYGMLVFGGFDGQLKSDVLVYVIGDCTSLSTKELCLTAMPGVKCVWNKAAKKCEPLASLFKEGYEKCPVSVTESPDAVSGWPVSAWPIGNQMNYTSLCSSISSCPTCLHTTFNCVWCGHSCQYAKCKEGFSKGFPSLHTSLVQCQVADANSCRLLHSCSACHTEPHCRWESDARCYTYVRKVGNRTEKVDVKDEQTCDIPCSMRTNCRNCTHGSCLWCSNQNRCVDKNAYIPSFPYGLCTEWTTQSTKCRDPDFPELEESEITNRNTPLGASVYTKMTTCVSYRTCASCQEDPSCGWCDDGTNRGTGSCMPGGYGGSMTTLFKQATDFQCPADRWYFTDCPLCQCNGHSTCEEATQLCNQPCLHLTEGNHCESCTPGYFGNPVNGGVCAPCQCSGHGTQCHPLTGRCFCTTKGVVGDHCERCDVANHYSSGLLTVTPATSSNLTFLPTCYYDLQLDFQFTFNLSKKEDRHIKQINFRNVPLKPDLDLEFSVLCSSVAKLNISVRSVKPNSLHKTMDDFDEEKFLLVNHTFTTFKSRFLRSDYHFGTDENTTFYVYVYDFQSPIWIQVSFSQHPKLELQQFFITFSACFISLLMMAAILWKIKQKYDMYRRRQRLFVEMEQMASRPFSHVLVELQVPPTFRRRTHVPYANRCQSVMTDSRSQTAANSTTVETSFSCTASPYGHPHPTVPAQTVRRRRRFRPSPIALEPCADQKAAVLSLLIRLPSGTLPYTPPGQSGLAIASTLVSLGSYASRKNVTDSRDMTRSIPKAKTPPTLTQLP